jgi:hypothetical protein
MFALLLIRDLKYQLTGFILALEMTILSIILCQSVPCFVKKKKISTTMMKDSVDETSGDEGII